MTKKMKTTTKNVNPAVAALCRAGVKIRAAREANGLSFAAVARQAGMTAASVRRAEEGASLTALNIGRIAAAVGLRFENLFS